MVKRLLSVLFPLHSRLSLAQKGVTSALDMFEFAKTKLSKASDRLSQLINECDLERQHVEAEHAKATERADNRVAKAMHVKASAEARVKHNDRVVEKLQDFLS